MSTLYTVGKPSRLDLLTYRLRYRSKFRALAKSPPLDDKQRKIVADLRRDGCVTLPHFIPDNLLRRLQSDLERAMEELRFDDVPYLDRSKIDPSIHPPLEKIMLMSPGQLKQAGLAIDRSDFQSYEQVIRDFKVPELVVHMLQHSELYSSVWLDPYLLSIVSNYLGLVPQLSEAYVRRSFPSPHKISNNYWHRDCVDHKVYLLKVFVFLSDCTVDTGPHEYIKGSITEKHKIDSLNGKRFYYHEEVKKLYPDDSPDRVVSIVPAGTIVLEDTRGLHRADELRSGHRDLGYAVFKPTSKQTNYAIPRETYANLTEFQKKFIPEQCILD